jgi:uncharacterized coiled-coil DUF342 family protein
MKSLLIAVPALIALACPLRPARAGDEPRERERIMQRLEAMLREADELQESGRANEADRLRQEAAELKRSFGQGQEQREVPPRLREGFERLEHVRQAVEHLKAAGLHDLAQAAAQQAEGMERDLQAAMEATEREQHREQPPELAEIREVLADLRAEIDGLRQEVRELREQSRKPEGE